MAGFFSLGGDGGGRPPSTDQTHRCSSDEETGQAAPNSNPTNPTESWFWPYGSRAVDPVQSHHQHELWLQQQQQGGFSTAWQDAQQQHHQGIAWGFGPCSRPSSMNNASDEGSSRSASVRGGVSCQDCGNQAKKDCAHMRCRTCCKSRGFDCPTHVKSTWVPAAKRRERQRQFAAALRHHPPQQFRGSSSGGGGGLDDPKRLRENSSMAQLAAATTTTSGLELGNFPAELSSTALFRCMRVSSAGTGDPEDHYAYQTSVTIGGHVFKGILYDRGPDATYTGGGESSSGGGSGSASAAQQQLNLMTVAATAAESSGMLPSAAAPYDPNSSIYTATPINAYMDGTQFCPHQRS